MSLKHLHTEVEFSIRGIMFALLLLALAALSGACSGSGGDSNEDGDFDYADNESEDAESGSYIVSLELTPPASSGYPAQQIIGLDAGKSGVSLTLRRSVNYSGRVVDPDGKGTEAVISMVYSQSNGYIPGHNLSPLTISSSEPGESGESVFSVDPLPGIYSRFVYSRDEKAFPPLVLRDGLEISQRLSETITFLRGYALGGAIYDHDQVPGVGLRVLAYDGSDNKYRSNVAISGEDGRFSDLRLPNHAGRYNIEISASESQPLFPTTVFKELIWVGDSGILSPETAQLNIEIEKFFPVECAVSGSVKGGDGSPVAGATLVFSGIIGGGRFERQCASDQDGNYTISLLRVRSGHPEDTYSLTIMPPLESDYAVLKSESLDCSSETHVFDFVLARRLTLGGVVRSPDGEVFPGVEVLASKKASADESSVYVKSTLTDEEGAYRISIDPGTYDISFIPPSGMQHARVSVYDIQLSTDGVLNQQMPEGRSFSGRVLDSDGLAAPAVYIEIYRVRPQKQNADLIGAGTTDNGGNFDILLP